jgi:hypothetical protein
MPSHSEAIGTLGCGDREAGPRGETTKEAFLPNHILLAMGHHSNIINNHELLLLRGLTTSKQVRTLHRLGGEHQQKLEF